MFSRDLSKLNTLSADLNAISKSIGSTECPKQSKQTVRLFTTTTKLTVSQFHLPIVVFAASTISSALLSFPTIAASVGTSFSVKVGLLMINCATLANWKLSSTILATSGMCKEKNPLHFHTAINQYSATNNRQLTKHYKEKGNGPNNQTTGIYVLVESIHMMNRLDNINVIHVEFHFLPAVGVS